MECIILWVFGNKKSYESEQHPVLLYKMSHSWIEYLNERYSNWAAESKHNEKTTDNHDNRLTKREKREKRGEGNSLPLQPGSFQWPGVWSETGCSIGRHPLCRGRSAQPNREKHLKTHWSTKKEFSTSLSSINNIIVWGNVFVYEEDTCLISLWGIS